MPVIRWLDPAFLEEHPPPLNLLYLKKKSICIVKRLRHMDYTYTKLYYGIIFWAIGINVTWQWRHNGLSSKSNFSPVRHGTFFRNALRHVFYG